VKQRITRGRPQASSQEMLQDAAFELFLEYSYAKTTVENITQRAGVSRATFFNYFSAKSDVFWIELDHALARLGDELEASTADHSRHTIIGGLEAVGNAILAVASEFGPHRVPFALTQHELVGSVHELQSSAMSRLRTQAQIITDFLRNRGLSPETAQAAAYACIAAAISGAQMWASAGPTRGLIEPYIRTAIEPVIIGFGVDSVEPQNTP